MFALVSTLCANILGIAWISSDDDRGGGVSESNYDLK